MCDMETERRPLPPESWIAILHRVFGLEDELDLSQIDVVFEGLECLTEALTPSERVVLWARFVDGLTLKDAGKRLGNKSGSWALHLERSAIRKLRRPKQMRVIKSCVAGHWRFYEARKCFWMSGALHTMSGYNGFCELGLNQEWVILARKGK